MVGGFGDEEIAGGVVGEAEGLQEGDGPGGAGGGGSLRRDGDRQGEEKGHGEGDLWAEEARHTREGPALRRGRV